MSVSNNREDPGAMDTHIYMTSRQYQPVPKLQSFNVRSPFNSSL